MNQNYIYLESLLVKKKKKCYSDVFLLLSIPDKGFPGGSVVNNPPAKPETWILSLGQENLQKEERATHSSILAWKIPWTEEPGGL